MQARSQAILPDLIQRLWDVGLTKAPRTPGLQDFLRIMGTSRCTWDHLLYENLRNYKLCPTDSIRNLFGEASRVVDNPARQGSFTLSQKFSLLEKALPSYFDYREMAKRSLGETWNSLNPSQREEFVKDFGSLLKASQARSLLLFNKGRVTYQPQILKAEYAEVPLVIMPPNDKISVSFRMFKKTQGWMIYDLVIDGVSSMDHYKAQFARIIQESSFKNLLKVLKAKIQEKSLP